MEQCLQVEGRGRDKCVDGLPLIAIRTLIVGYRPHHVVALDNELNLGFPNTLELLPGLLKKKKSQHTPHPFSVCVDKEKGREVLFKYKNNRD